MGLTVLHPANTRSHANNGWLNFQLDAWFHSSNLNKSFPTS